MAALSTVLALSALGAAAFSAKQSASQKGQAAPPAPVVPPAPDPAAEGKKKEDSIRRLRGKAPIAATSGSTLLTGPSGLGSGASTERKTLLGV